MDKIYYSILQKIYIDYWRETEYTECIKTELQNSQNCRERRTEMGNIFGIPKTQKLAGSASFPMRYIVQMAMYWLTWPGK